VKNVCIAKNDGTKTDMGTFLTVIMDAIMLLIGESILKL